MSGIDASSYFFLTGTVSADVLVFRKVVEISLKTPQQLQL